ncbi:NAD-dependent epimerase/dehydratase family protein [Flavobacteriaceae bacterium S0825]|uniref:NAD-dependent epimerase/dehydratase family protein n=1 Tax=Gaetbulibacter sp. S0825 TaxID=2720084 RepID=UPI001430CABE|nr:NAD-dependent epimerase/dehydratase family protein [Gaetbulibacter sp. S0825]MCK0109359.1 NAD-dependent epimerase/dehydratase family protein [Flavobacteriaceae bacterium S0825]NIX64993.1 NAD-dependent epimerase/dehydratase family protein [Gaetbulibacter sp. S0825]
MTKKPTTRRQFIERGAKLGIAIPLISSGLLGCNFNEEKKVATTKASSKKLNILILGGTSFLGPHQIAYALGRGHSVSTFTRGKTKPTIHQELFKNVTSLVGDRNNDLSALETGTWDVVIDNSGRDVEWTKNSAELLKDRTDLYLYTSSTGVYYPYLTDDINEDTKVLLEEPETLEDEEMRIEYWYGVMKANSELAAKKAYGEDRTIIVRPTYMFGPADKTNRFVHWPLRLSKGGEVLVLGKPQDPVQYIDVRDVAEFMIRLIEEKHTDTFNAAGPKTAQNMYDFVEEASKAFDVEHTFVKVDDYEFLKANKVPYLVPWIMPEGNNYGSARANIDKALAAGLTYRDLPTSIRETYNWWHSDGVTDEIRQKFEGNTKNVFNREAEIIAAWKKHKNS